MRLGKWLGMKYASKNKEVKLFQVMPKRGDMKFAEFDNRCS